MAKEKKPIRKKIAPKTTAKKQAPAKKKNLAKPKAASQEPISEEYATYLERYELYGEGRPRLKSSEFDELDDELLDLLAQELDHGLSDDQTIRLKELEFLLLDSEQ